jgi:hypothetical protein
MSTYKILKGSVFEKVLISPIYLMVEDMLYYIFIQGQPPCTPILSEIQYLLQHGTRRNSYVEMFWALEAML